MTTRRLAAILAADVVGFSSMMEKDEEGTASHVRSMRREVIEPKLSAHHARPVRVYALVGATLPKAEPKSLTLPDKPSIAVLPFTNMSGDPEQEYFADGVVEDIITALSHFKGLFVIARNSTSLYKGRAIDVKQVGKDLGVRYVLEGSVRRGGKRLRVTGQLVEAATGRHVWADKIEGGVEEVFDFQDRITECVVGAIQPSLLEAEAERLRPRATDSLSAYELYLRALPLLDRVSREGCSDAKVLLTKATEADPQFGVAYATAAQCHVQRLFQGWSDDPPREESEGMILVSAALEKGNDDAEVLWRAGFALSAFGGDLDRCLAMLKRALELSPNSAHAWQWLGWVQVYAGQYERAAGSFERAWRLSPRDIRAFVTTIGLSAYYFLGNFEEAVRLAREAVAQNPRFTSSWRFLAAALAQSGRQAEAEDAVRSLLSLDPRLTTRSISGGIRKTPNLHFYFNGLRNAGLPE
jgi:adenylate cyclase